MKTISKFIVLVLFISPILSLGQNIPAKTIKNKTVKIKKPSKRLNSTGINKNVPILKKMDIKVLESSKSQIPNAKPLVVNKDLLSIPSKKKYRITPKKPYDNGLGFAFFGQYSPSFFKVSPRFSGNSIKVYSRNDYYTYSGFIIFNAQANKDYRVEIRLKDVIGSGKITINDQISSVSASNQTINYIFSTSSAGQYIITLGPYELNGGVNPIDFNISSIQIDELED